MVYAAFGAGLAGMDAIKALADGLGVLHPAVGAPPLKDAGSEVRPERRREARRAAVLAWLVERVPDARTVAVQAAFVRLAECAAPAPKSRPVPTPALHIGVAPTSEAAKRIERLQSDAIKLHNKGHMLRQRRRNAELTGLIEAELAAGNHVLVAGAILDQLPVQYALEQYDQRARFTRSLAEARMGAELPEAERLHALIEGLGTNMGWRDPNAWTDQVLSKRTARLITQARQDLERGGGRALPEARIAALHRRLDIASVVLLRIQGSRGRAAREPRVTLEIYKRAWRLAVDAQHESLAMSLLLDAARFAIDEGMLDLAGHFVDRVKYVASQQGNERRWTQALIVRAQLKARREDVGAWFDLARAEALYRNLQTLDGPDRRPAKDWYQPGLLVHIEEVRREITPWVAPPETWPWWEE